MNYNGAGYISSVKTALLDGDGITDNRNKRISFTPSRLGLYILILAAFILGIGIYSALAGSDPAETGESGFTYLQIQKLIFNLLGGVALLIYGIVRMGEGLQKAAGERMRAILSTITGKPIHGVLVGLGVTSIIQSSSATTVMVVGFVNARLMTLVQAVGVILGANIGTTVTGQLIAFKLTDYALPILAVGVGVYLFSKRKFVKNLGLFLLGFGMLFLGIVMMTDGVEILRTHPAVMETFRQFGEKPLLGVLAGLITTSIIQSSSATVGIAIAMTASGVLTIEQAIPIVLGDNIGTCITAVLASIGTSRNARRAALAHVMFNTIGTIWVLCVLKYFMMLVVHTSSVPARQVANAHTLFNVFNTLLFLPFVPKYSQLIERMIPGGRDGKGESVFLDDRLLKTPAIALDQAIKELARMTGYAAISLRSIEKSIRLKSPRALDAIDEDETALDELHRQTIQYIVAISEASLSPDLSEQIPAVLQCVDEIERIGDRAVQLKDLIEEKMGSKVEFSDDARLEMGALQDMVVNAVEEIHRALSYREASIGEGVLQIKEKFEEHTRTMRKDHIMRMCGGSCHVHAGIFFLEMMKLYEDIGYRCQTIAEVFINHLAIDKPTG